ncbi:hypothetical protein PUNSTDRAFT_44262 [Punctularia strigosozonata HHB-11173 SS5]|uniref:uncharacterized protein n=1 Tax=Punctularia strigosozonata (strain HHB-11173) TaxID=741275 RepID=UPI00044179C5|nr:uncharacterized protein PUNSTDRAFT_44262 [Punctularia strigosozonata HHB-11173 SS5]EIN10108.1 hypothetical protein PUNSTDRAFT_44262 [Punctularia strigosozonata HHB-11173 SS5]
MNTPFVEPLAGQLMVLGERTTFDFTRPAMERSAGINPAIAPTFDFTCPLPERSAVMRRADATDVDADDDRAIEELLVACPSRGKMRRLALPPVPSASYVPPSSYASPLRQFTRLEEKSERALVLSKTMKHRNAWLRGELHAVHVNSEVTQRVLQRALGEERTMKRLLESNVASVEDIQRDLQRSLEEERASKEALRLDLTNRVANIEAMRQTLEQSLQKEREAREMLQRDFTVRARNSDAVQHDLELSLEEERQEKEKAQQDLASCVAKGEAVRRDLEKLLEEERAEKKAKEEINQGLADRVKDSESAQRDMERWLKEEQADKEKTREDLASRVTTSEAIQRDLEKSLKEEQAAKEALKKDLDACTMRVQELETQASRQQENMEKLEAEIEQRDTMIKNLEEELENQRAEASAERQKFGEKMEELTAEKQKLKASHDQQIQKQQPVSASGESSSRTQPVIPLPDGLPALPKPTMRIPGALDSDGETTGPEDIGDVDDADDEGSSGENSWPNTSRHRAPSPSRARPTAKGKAKKDVKGKGKEVVKEPSLAGQGSGHAASSSNVPSTGPSSIQMPPVSPPGNMLASSSSNIPSTGASSIQAPMVSQSGDAPAGSSSSAQPSGSPPPVSSQAILPDTDGVRLTAPLIFKIGGKGRKTAIEKKARIALTQEKEKFAKSNFRAAQLEIAVKGEEADEDIVAAFNAGGDVRPDPKHPRFTLISPSDNLWNRYIISMLAQKMLQQQDEEGFVTYINKKFVRIPRATFAYWEDLCWDQWTRIRGFWVEARPRVVTDLGTGSARLEQHDEITARIVHKEATSDRSSRMAARRHRLLLRRERVCQIMVQEAQTSIDQKFWATAQEVLELLGEEGMSSDETNDEAGIITYRAHAQEWRRDLDRMMQKIDVARDGAFTRRGVRPSPRIRTGRDIALGAHGGTLRSIRKPPHSLPRELYDADWLATRTQQYNAHLAIKDVDIGIAEFI